jgi:methylthioribose-1-phosphate isomerase
MAALLLRGDRVAVNGDCGVVVGGLSAAIVAAAADVPVIVLAPRSSFDPAAADGAALRADETFAHGTARLNPSSDVVPDDLVTRLVSEPA